MIHAVDVFADLSCGRLPAQELGDLLKGWSSADGLAAQARRLTCVVPPGLTSRIGEDLPPGWCLTETTSPVKAAAVAFESASRDGVPVLLLGGPVAARTEAVGMLRHAVAADPMLGFAVPRIACVRGCCIARIVRHGIGEGEWIARRVLAELPATEFLPHFAGICTLAAADVVANFGPLDSEFEDLGSALIHYMARARRHGFRTLLVNRAVVTVAGHECTTRPPWAFACVSDHDRVRLRHSVPDIDRTWNEFRGSSWERFERVWNAASRASAGAGRSLLIDARNVGALHNGTAQAVLGLMTGLRKLNPGWRISVLANPDGAQFHRLEQTYRNWPLHTTLPDEPFTATLRPSQPWGIQDIADAHATSLFNVYLMLDTIAWDVGYMAPRGLDATWHLLAECADGLLFDSEFTRERFLQRFPEGRKVPGATTYLSFDYADYVRTDVPRETEDFVLVIGNALDHKDVEPTVDLLASAFPYQRITVLGSGRRSRSKLVTSLRSGELPDRDLHALYATARFVVYPSLYEGFGFPILTALGYGRTVLARRSSLLEEVTRRAEPRGRLVGFTTRDELVHLLGRLLHREPVPECPLQGQRGASHGWRDVARATIEFLDRVVSGLAGNRWIARERAVRRALASSGS